MNKRGETKFVLMILSFIILNVLFFGLLFVFVHSSASGALVYEQAYAKQIALFLDSAKPSMQIKLDMGKGIELAEDDREKTLTSDEKKGLLKISGGNVLVSLGKEGYSMNYFSDYDVGYYFDENFLVLNIEEEK